jgi:hypothetical protein
MYHIIEIQTFENGSSAIVHNSNGAIPQASDAKEARAVFHEKMAYAERSNLPCHAVLVIDETGNVVVRDYCLPKTVTPEE